MRKEKYIGLVKRLSLFFIGMIIIQFAVGMYLKVNLGSDPFTVFNQGLAVAIGITPGQANMIILVVLAIVVFILDKKYVNIGTLICVFGVGPFIDIALKVYSHFPIDEYNFIVKLLLFIIATFGVGIGFSILSSTKLGIAPNDGVYFVIKDKTKFQYRWVRMSTDIIYLIIGFLLGGVIGIGTILTVILVGPCVQFCIPYGEKIVSSIVNEKVIL